MRIKVLPSFRGLPLKPITLISSSFPTAFFILESRLYQRTYTTQTSFKQTQETFFSIERGHIDRRYRRSMPARAPCSLPAPTPSQSPLCSLRVGRNRPTRIVFPGQG